MAKQWIEFPRVEGVTSRQAHADLPAGTFEREVGRDGFFGPVTHFHHAHPPTAWTNFEGPLKPRAFDLNKLNALDNTSPFSAPLILGNRACAMRQWILNKNMSALARNADGDELLFIHNGSGDLFCDYGHLAIRDGDYVVIPRGTMWRIEVSVPMTLLLIEATDDAYRLPDKGMLGMNAIFDPACLDTPKIDDVFKAQQRDVETQVQVKRRNTITTITYPFSPLDAIGWHGTLAPVRINWRDIRPVMSHRYHLPPSVHTTFLASRFVVCTFVPRPIESDPGALKVPFFHNNDEYDEVIFYHRGEFFSRDNIKPGMVTFHPSGFTHGPHPKAFAAGAASTKKETDEVAVMIDTRDALDIASLPEGIENTEYVNSWKPK